MVYTTKIIENDFYSEGVHGEYESFDLGDFTLEMGGTIRDAKLAYKTYGQLNKVKDNAILFTIMYSGSHAAMSAYIGDEMALDPNKYFIILVNQLGGGLSSSPHNTPPPFNQSSFPELTIGDDVNAQYKLITEKFGIKKLELVLGWSMGAQQTYEWIVRHPEMVKRAAPIAGSAKVTPHVQIFTSMAIDAITSDSAWNHGYYTEPNAVHVGLRREAKLFAFMGLSASFYNNEEWRSIGFSSQQDFLIGFFENWFILMDPNNLICLLRKWKRGNVSKNINGDLNEALSNVKAKVHVIAFEQDTIIPLSSCEAEQKKIPNSELKTIPSPWGHFAALLLAPDDKSAMDNILRKLLESD